MNNTSTIYIYDATCKACRKRDALAHESDTLSVITCSECGAPVKCELHASLSDGNDFTLFTKRGVITCARLARNASQDAVLQDDEQLALLAWRLHYGVRMILAEDIESDSTLRSALANDAIGLCLHADHNTLSAVACATISSVDVLREAKERAAHAQKEEVQDARARNMH